ncbi:MAG: restriction endonuclease [Flavobacteriaceae bacterium]
MLKFFIILFAIVIIILALFKSKIDKYYDDLEIEKFNQKQKEEEGEFNRRIEEKLNELEVLKEDIFKRKINEFKNELIDEIKPHINTLDLKSNQLVYKDDYGDVVLKDWIKERDDFVNRKLDFIFEKIIEECKNELDILFDFNSYPRYGLRSEVHYYFENHIFSQICELIDAMIQQTGTDVDYYITTEVNLSDPILFEESISGIFRNSGWNSRKTKSTGDQGADVIAKKEDNTCVVQCKLYSSPVGNKAVQEVYSAKNFYQGNIAVVVTNSSFTKSAKQLANSTNVILLHYKQLPEYLKEIN